MMKSHCYTGNSQVSVTVQKEMHDDDNEEEEEEVPNKRCVITLLKDLYIELKINNRWGNYPDFHFIV